jgi:hypothetical protein
MRVRAFGVAFALVALVACGGRGSAGSAPPPAVVVGGEGGTPVLLELVELLVVRDEPVREGYDRELFDHWGDVNGTGCTARQDVLIAQAVGLLQRDVTQPCTVVEGDWFSLFDGETYSGAPSEISVDHVVALAEAWDSGASAWSFRERQLFANDPVHLLVTTTGTNQVKADLDAGEWRPPRRDAWCVTASMMILAKVAYSLSVDPAERRGLVEMAQTCDRGGQRSVPGVPLPGTAEFDALARSAVARMAG